MIFIIMGAWSFQCSFICIPQILWWLIYLYLAIRIESPFYTARIYIAYFLLIYTGGALLAKMVLSVLVATSYLDESTLIQSMGIQIQSEILQFQDIIFTYAWDSIALFICPLFIQRSKIVKKSELENPVKYAKFIKTCKDVDFYYPSLITFTILVSTLGWIFVPSVICAILLIMNLVIVYIWSFGFLDDYTGLIGFWYRMTFYLSTITYLASYVIEIPIINEMTDNLTLQIIGLSLEKGDLSVYYWGRNTTLWFYIALYSATLRAEEMIKKNKVEQHKEEYQEKDVAKMTQAEFAEFIYQRKQKEKGIQNITNKLLKVLMHPLWHSFWLTIMQFLWVFIYVWFESWLLVFWILYGIIELNKRRYIKSFNIIYFPLISCWMIVMYIANIQGVLSDDWFTLNLCKYGLFNFENPFVHFVLQLFVITYSLFSKRLYLKFKKDEEIENLIQIKIKRRISNRRMEKLKSNLVKNNQFTLERVTSLEFDQHIQLNSIPKKTTVEIILGFVISHWDIILMTSLYFAGAYEIDIYHIALMIFFVCFLLYPEFWRRNYLFLILFIDFIVLIKYLYTLTYDWLDDISKEYLEVLGFSTTLNENNKFFKSNLINNNWLIVLLSYIQFRTYKSEYFQKKLSPEAIEDDRKEFARKHPKWTWFFNMWKDFAYISVPWLSFIAYIVNAFLNSKTAINFIILFFDNWTNT